MVKQRTFSLLFRFRINLGIYYFFRYSATSRFQLVFFLGSRGLTCVFVTLHLFRALFSAAPVFTGL